MRINSIDSPDGTTAHQARARRMGVVSYSSAQVAEAMVLPPPRVPMHFASDYILPCRSVGNRLVPEDLRGLTLLIFSHVNPCDTFKLDMEASISLEADEASEVPLKEHLEP
jgi:hypothetical protein